MGFPFGEPERISKAHLTTGGSEYSMGFPFSGRKRISQSEFKQGVVNTAWGFHSMRANVFIKANLNIG